MPLRNKQLRIFRREAPVQVLGPGKRAVIWLQGCSRRCVGCIAPEAWDALAGQEVDISDLAEWVLGQAELEGLTLSGGEPFEQADGLSELIQTVRSERDLGVVCYTGFQYAELQAGRSQGWSELLAAIDLLVDGPYIEEQHASLLWRGSRNQRLIPLTERYQALLEALTSDTDQGAGLELAIGPDGMNFTGVPTRPGFRKEVTSQLLGMGIRLNGGEPDGS